MHRALLKNPIREFVLNGSKSAVEQVIWTILLLPPLLSSPLVRPSVDFLSLLPISHKFKVCTLIYLELDKQVETFLEGRRVVTLKRVVRVAVRDCYQLYKLLYVDRNAYS